MTKRSIGLAESPRSDQKLLYVMHDHPSVSQTFVVTEAAAVRAAGVPVVGYALHVGGASKPAAPMDLVCPPPQWWRLVLEVCKAPQRFWRALWRARCYRMSLRERLRLVFAQAHAEYAWPHVRALGVTHVHAHFLGRTADVACALADKLGAKWTATAHAQDAYAPSEPGLFRRRIDHVAGVVCASERVQRAAIARAVGSTLRTRVVRCGVDTHMLADMEDRNEGHDRTIVTIGRLVATKGHWTILRAAEDVLNRDELLRWTIIGGGELDGALRRDERYRALYPRLKLAGPLDHQAALRALAGARAFVLPCEPDATGDSDGIPVALMEAMALKVPVITTNVGGIGELVTDHVTGFVVEPRDSNSLIRALSDVLYHMDKNELDQIRRAGLEKVMDEFSAEREAAKLISFLGEASGQTSGATKC